jgi:hypothetical protein
MIEEQKKLYFFTKNHFSEQLERISPTCISPMIAVRQVVKKAIYQYINDYCTKDTNPEAIFSQDDFLQVSNKIYNEIMEEGSNNG